MASILLRSTLFVIFTIYAFGDEIEMEVQSNTVLKMLRCFHNEGKSQKYIPTDNCTLRWAERKYHSRRWHPFTSMMHDPAIALLNHIRRNVTYEFLMEMVNQTTADTLNLPANATSIRENITDTFSCENRTYGYYADVDNECQLFHVCLPVQLATGRNLTYKYSFICPKETVFNQEVLVCTRPRESIPCEESPSFYDLNMEIGKIVDPDVNKEDSDTNINKQTENIPIKENANTKKQNRNQNRKKQNIIMDALLKEAEEQMGIIDEVDEKPVDIETEKETKIEMAPYDPEVKIDSTQYKQPEVFIETSDNKPESKIETPQYKPYAKIDTTQYYPQLKTETTQYGTEMKIEPVHYPEVISETSEYNPNVTDIKDEFENSRLGSERSSKRTGRKIWRGSMKFKTV